MMKRKRETSRERLPPISASEFALIVNQPAAAQDPLILLRALQRFVRTVQRDRKMAAAEDCFEHIHCADEDSEDDSLIDAVADSSAKRRRYKKDEVWKEDSAKYNVPFVGTAVASKGADPSIQGEWPTGLLKAYLTKSPLAIELTCDTLSPSGKNSDVHKRLLRTHTGNKELQRKNRKLSEAIYKAYLKALAELCTAAIPLDKSEKDDGEEEPRFVAELLTKRLPHLLNLLAVETNNGKGNSAIVGGCGPLAAPVIQILERLSLVSTRTARHVVRSLEQSLPDGVMHFLLMQRQPQRQILKSPQIEKEVGDGDEGGNTMTTKWFPRGMARVAALQLAATLAEMDDSVVFSCISTTGVKERKIRPGMLFLSLQRGLFIGEIENWRHSRVVARLLLAVRKLLERPTIAKQSLADLFSRDFIQKLILFSMQAPPLTSRMGFLDVLAGTDTYGNDDKEVDDEDRASIGSVACDAANRHRLAIEARRLLFVLLGDAERSPLLHSLLAKRPSMAVHQLVVRAMVQLLDCTADPDHQIRLFVVHIANLVPLLFPSFMRNIPLPEIKRPFAFATQLFCLSTLLSEGPSAADCFGVDDTNGSALSQQNDEAILLSILPSALKRQIFTKACQSKNHLVALMSLKLFLVVLERCRIFLADLAGKGNGPGDLKPLVTKLLTRGIPDATMLLMTLPNLDFRKRADAVLFGHACEAIQTYARVFKSHPYSTKVEWTKLVPNDPSAFRRVPLLLQKMVLSSVRYTVTSRKTLSNFHSSSFESLMGIVISARSSHIYQLSRSIAVDVLCRISPKAESEDALKLRTIWKYEATCWVDGLSSATVNEFCRLIEKTVLATMPTFVTLLRAWRSAGLPVESIPTTQPSSILIQALEMLPKTSDAFSLLIMQVASKCLLFDINPLPVAALILDAAHKPKTHSLASYARSLIYYDEYTATKRISLVMQMLTDHFSVRSFPANLFLTCRSVVAPRAPLILAPDMKAFAKLDCLALAQQILHLATISREGGHESFDKLLRRMLPAALSCSSLLASMNWLLPSSFRRMKKYFSNGDFFFDCTLISGSRLEVATYSHTGLDTNRGCAAVSAAGIRSTLFSYLIGPFLSDATLIASVVDLIPGSLETTKTSFEDLSSKVLRQYLRLIIQKVNWKARDRLSTTRFSSSIFHSWLSLSDEDLSDGILFEVAKQFEALLCRTLPHTFSSVMLLTTSSDLLLRRCLVSKLSMKNLENKSSSGCLMASLIASDPVRFGPSFLQLHKEHVDNDCYVRIFDYGLLDSALCSTFECHAFEKPLQAVESLGILLDKRSRMLLSEWHSVLTECFISALLAFTTDLNLLERVPFSSHILLVSKILQERRLEKHIWLQRTHQNVVLLALRLCGQRSDGAPMLSATLLEYLLCALPPTIREFFKGEAITDAALSALSFLLRCLKEVFAVSRSFDTKHFGLDVSQRFSSLIRSCLRYGIATSGNDKNSIRELMLQIVQQLVPLLHPEHSKLSVLVTSFSKPFGTHVFELMISHSKFAALLLSPTSNAERKVRLEALRLMKACLLAAEDIDFNVDVWFRLLACYDAGTADKDLLVLEVLVLIARCAPSGSPYTALDQLRWGRNFEKPGKSGWDWLVDGLDVRRVYATLERFPVRDPLFIRPDQTEDSLCGSTALDDEHECMPYSPGFLLPLLLGALEDEKELRFLERNKRSSESGVPAHSSSASKSSQYLIAQRLCDKGGLALTLVSLCSDKAAIRKLSVSILGAFIEVVGSKEAHQMSSWRDRPQLALVLNAVQRSLVVRQAEDHTTGGGNASISAVPKLPGFSAVFLARASLLLSRPNDPLFVAINRAFLRSETDFGAFQDLTRIPAFVSLFCSSSNDQDQLKSERRFSLDIARDGFTGEELYKLLVACHCPELLLTSLESSRACSFLQREDEALLILQTLTKLIALGGDQAASHLIDRMGLFPWLRSLLCGGNINALFSSQSARSEVLFLLVEVTRRASTRMSASELVTATSGFAQSVLSMAIEMIDCTTVTRASASKANATTIDQVCEFLTLVQAFYLDSGRFACEKCYQSDGYNAASAVMFLSKIDSDKKELESRCIGSLCILPLHPSNHIQQFCEAVLSKLTSNCAILPQNQTLLAVLQRVGVLWQASDCSKARRHRILLDLQALWSPCARDHSLRKAWFQCLSQVAGTHNEVNSSRSTSSSGEDDLIAYIRFHLN